MAGMYMMLSLDDIEPLLEIVSRWVLVDSQRFSSLDFKGDVVGGVTTAIISLPLPFGFWSSGRSWPLRRYSVDQPR